jgi:hypothetical protein
VEDGIAQEVRHQARGHGRGLRRTGGLDGERVGGGLDGAEDVDARGVERQDAFVVLVDPIGALVSVARVVGVADDDERRVGAAVAARRVCLHGGELFESRCGGVVACGGDGGDAKLEQVFQVDADGVGVSVSLGWSWEADGLPPKEASRGA